ncbi:hypothetical protein ABE521_06310 [Pseudomonas sp. TWI672]|uniref:hypothetical protein n=1 Tax=unclassified Pseudomonas TaxID=196821 RepID=UPI00320A4200
MAKPTLEEYLSYLSVEPRTKGWGALLVYDRFKTNMLLAQEHIERFDGSHWLKPISLRVETEDNSWTDISELTLDKPSLSFVNSNISSSAARLSMHVSGGKFKQLRKALGSGQTELVGLSRLDPLSAPAVRMNINLNQSNNGTITDEGRVTLDLSQGSAYTFEVSSWKDLNEKVGSAIQRAFAALPAEERVWELNTLKPVEGELKPTSFAVRTHSLAKAGQSIVSSDPAELDEGAVVVGVAFNGARGGDFPTRDEDMPYLLPESGSSDPFTMNLLVGNDVWSKQVLAQMFKKVPGYENEQPEYESQAGFITQLTWPGLTLTSPEQTHRFSTPPLYEGLDGAITARRIDGFKAWRFDLLRTSVNMTLASKGGVIVLEWKGQWPPSEDGHPVLESDEFVWRANGGNGSLAVKYPVVIDYTCRQNFALELETAGEHKGRVKVVKKEQQIDVALAQYDGRQFVWLEEVFKTAQDLFKTSFKNAFDQVVTAVASAGASIDVLRLNGLLFRSEQIAEPRNLQVPGDLSLLGTLAPKLTAFAVEPLEATLSAGTTQTFRLAPLPGAAVAWSLDHLPGESGDKGTIANGVYTAPASDAITGTSKRVIVTATAGDQVSRALVTVVPQGVSVFPFMLSGQFSDQSPAKPSRYVVVGGSLGAPLSWAMKPGSKGTLRLPGAEDSDLDIPVDKETRIYVAPTRQPGASGTVDFLMQLDTVTVSSGAHTEAMDVVIPWTTTTAEIRVTAQTDNTLKLALWVQSWDEGDVEIPPADTQWFLVKGEGDLSTTGIYTPGAEGDYIIVAAFDKTSTRLPLWDYAVLPMPYEQTHIELVEHVQVHSTQRRS